MKYLFMLERDTYKFIVSHVYMYSHNLNKQGDSESMKKEKW